MIDGVLLKKAGLSLVAAVVGLLVIEGAISITAGRSLLRDHGAVLVPPRSTIQPPTDAERRSGLGTQYYVTHEDPLVRYVHRPDAELHYVEALAHTDELGMRVRPGTAPADNALRLVVLGDSIAFGFGVADDETIAARLEQLLNASRGPNARPIAGFTVAVPSWNHRAALNFLLDHYDSIRPDIVIYLPVVNDLSDQASVYGTGDMHLVPDPSAPDPWLLVNRSQSTSLENRLSPRWEDPQMGPRAASADLTPESSRRYDENADSILTLHRILAARGARLVIAQSGFGGYARHLAVRLADREPTLPVLFLERGLPVEMTLVVNNHPSAETLRARAIHVARWLVQAGWIGPGAGNPLPPVPAAWSKLLAPDLDAATLRSAGERSRQLARDALRPLIDVQTGEGIRQVFGGLNLDGSVRMHTVALLAAAGDTVHVVLQPLVGRRDLYPLTVAIDIDGQPAGEAIVGPGRPRITSLPLPAGLAGTGRPFELRLRPARWVVVKDKSRSQVASAHLLRLDARE